LEGVAQHADGADENVETTDCQDTFRQIYQNCFDLFFSTFITPFL